MRQSVTCCRLSPARFAAKHYHPHATTRAITIIVTVLLLTVNCDTPDAPLAGGHGWSMLLRAFLSVQNPPAPGELQYSSPVTLISSPDSPPRATLFEYFDLRSPRMPHAPSCIMLIEIVIRSQYKVFCNWRVGSMMLKLNGRSVTPKMLNLAKDELGGELSCRIASLLPPHLK